MGERSLILGVDRLDYTKGIPERFRGFAQLLRRFPEHLNRVTLLQVAPVSRGEISRYRALRRELDELAGRINGENAEFDWTPVRYMTRGLPRNTLAGFYRQAHVGLVTPLRDGMNLVAKEYVVGAGSRGSGRAGPVAFRRRGGGTGWGVAGEPVRSGRGGRGAGCRPVNAAGGTAVALALDVRDGEAGYCPRLGGVFPGAVGGDGLIGFWLTGRGRGIVPVEARIMSLHSAPGMR